jgi:hypothetical protein
MAPARTATAAATPILTAYRADVNTMLATRAGMGGSVCFVAPVTETALLRLTQADAGPRAYQVRTVETTLWGNWFFTGGDFSSYTLLRSTAAVTIHARMTWRSDTGLIANSEDLTIPPAAVVVRDARKSLWAGVTIGSVEVAHDGEPQDIVGSQTTISPTSGFTIDGILQQRGR